MSELAIEGIRNVGGEAPSEESRRFMNFMNSRPGRCISVLAVTAGLVLLGGGELKGISADLSGGCAGPQHANAKSYPHGYRRNR